MLGCGKPAATKAAATSIEATGTTSLSEVTSSQSCARNGQSTATVSRLVPTLVPTTSHIAAFEARTSPRPRWKPMRTAATAVKAAERPDEATCVAAETADEAEMARVPAGRLREGSGKLHGGRGGSGEGAELRDEQRGDLPRDGLEDERACGTCHGHVTDVRKDASRRLEEERADEGQRLRQEAADAVRSQEGRREARPGLEVRAAVDKHVQPVREGLQAARRRDGHRCAYRHGLEKARACFQAPAGETSLRR